MFCELKRTWNNLRRPDEWTRPSWLLIWKVEGRTVATVMNEFKVYSLSVQQTEVVYLIFTDVLHIHVYMQYASNCKEDQLLLFVFLIFSPWRFYIYKTKSVTSSRKNMQDGLNLPGNNLEDTNL